MYCNPKEHLAASFFSSFTSLISSYLPVKDNDISNSLTIKAGFITEKLDKHASFQFQ
jgi:hypothetical protein